MSLEELSKRIFETGLLDTPRQSMIYTDEPKISEYITLPKNSVFPRFNHREDIFGVGSHTHKDIAMIKSAAECLERFCLFNPAHKNFTKGAAKDEGYVDPILFMHYSREQMKDRESFLQKVGKMEFKWWTAFDYFHKKSVLLPGQQVFLSKDFNDEININGETVSTGAAFGDAENKDAFYRGFLEVIERDSFMTAYLTKKEIPEVKNFSEELENFVAYLHRYQLEPRVFDITSDINVPSFMTVTLDKTGIGPAVAVGLCAGYDLETTILHSLMESIQARRTSRINLELDKNFKFPTEDEVISTESRFYYWYPLDRIAYLDFWLKHPTKVNFNDISYAKNIDETLKELEDRNYHLFVTDITLPEIRKNGLEVIKVMIPELHPLYLNEDAKSLYSIHAGEIKEDKSLKPHPMP